MDGHTQTAVATPVETPKAGMRKPLAIVLGGAAALLVAAIVWGIVSRAHASSELKEKTAEDAIPAVFTVHPTGGAGAQELVLPANVQAFTDTPIYARTSGYLKKWYADIGVHVKQGQLLATIETPELDQQLQQAKAELATAQANLELAKTTNERWQSLVAKHAVSKQEADQAESNLSARQSAVASAQANVGRLEQMQSFERVLAPFDGVITARNTDVGALIGAGTSAGSGASPQELFHLAAQQRLRIFVAVPEIYAGNIHTGDDVILTQDSLPGEIFHGAVARNSMAIDPVSRTLNVEVDFANGSGKLLPGAYVFAHFKLSGTNSAQRTVTVPSNTLLFRAEGLRVGVVRNNRVQLVPVNIGRDFGSTVELTSGVTAKDELILDPSDSLTSGAEVRSTLQKPQRQGDAQ